MRKCSLLVLIALFLAGFLSSAKAEPVVKIGCALKPDIQSDERIRPIVSQAKRLLVQNGLREARLNITVNVSIFGDNTLDLELSAGVNHKIKREGLVVTKETAREVLLANLWSMILEHKRVIRRRKT